MYTIYQQINIEQQPSGKHTDRDEKNLGYL